DAFGQCARFVHGEHEPRHAAVDRQPPVTIRVRRALQLARHAVRRRAHGFSRNTCRRSFPVGVRGSSSTKSTRRGYLCGEAFALPRPCSSRASASLGLTPGFSTTKARGLVRPSASCSPTTPASTTDGCEARSDSTSSGETYWPLTLIRSSLRPRCQSV